VPFRQWAESSRRYPPCRALYFTLHRTDRSALRSAVSGNRPDPLSATLNGRHVGRFTRLPAERPRGSTIEFTRFNRAGPLPLSAGADLVAAGAPSGPRHQLPLTKVPRTGESAHFLRRVLSHIVDFACALADWAGPEYFASRRGERGVRPVPVPRLWITWPACRCHRALAPCPLADRPTAHGPREPCPGQGRKPARRPRRRPNGDRDKDSGTQGAVGALRGCQGP
jgi:hypothetical protein